MPHRLSLTALTEKLSHRELSSREVTQACLDRIRDVDARLHAFLHVNEQDALAQAETADARLAAGERHPLLGVPIAIKDVLAVKGERLSCALVR